MNRLGMIIGSLVVLSVATFACLAAVGPQGPQQTIVPICHYSALHDQYNTLWVGLASQQRHLTEHPADYDGACTAR